MHFLRRPSEHWDWGFRHSPVICVNRFFGTEKMNRVTVEYYAQLREQAGLGREQVDTAAPDLSGLYAQLRWRHGFTLAQGQLKVAVNAAFADWGQALADGDTVVFIPPVAGG
jgi:molybdopterin synthase sulfur carrier subunit